MRHPLRNSLVSASTLIGGATVALLVMIYPWTIAFSGPGFRESLFAVATFAVAGGFILGLGYLLMSRVWSIWSFYIFCCIFIGIGIAGIRQQMKVERVLVAHGPVMLGQLRR